MTDSGHALSGTTTATPSGGVASFSTLQATPVTDDVLTARTPLTTSINLMATSTPFTVSAYQVSAAKSLLAATPDPAFTGSTVTVTATVETAGGVPIPGATVTFGAGASTTAGFSSATALTNASGVATVTVGDSVAETITLSATVTGAGLGSLSSTTVQFFSVVANHLWIADSNNKTTAFSATGVPFLSTAEPSAGGTGVASTAPAMSGA